MLFALLFVIFVFILIFLFSDAILEIIRPLFETVLTKIGSDPSLPSEADLPGKEAPEVSKPTEKGILRFFTWKNALIGLGIGLGVGLGVVSVKYYMSTFAVAFVDCLNMTNS
jgi:hypothetical protein